MKKAIRPTIEKMPLIFRNTKEVHYLNVSEYCEMFDKSSNDEVLEAEKLFHSWQEKGYPGIPVNMPVQIAVNHTRGLKKAYLAGGDNATTDYVRSQVQTVLDYRAKQANSGSGL